MVKYSTSTHEGMGSRVCHKISTDIDNHIQVLDIS